MIEQMNRTQAIIFDMDGVLIDSEELHAHAKRTAFRQVGITLTDSDLREYVGRSDVVMIEEVGTRCQLSSTNPAMTMPDDSLSWPIFSRRESSVSTKLRHPNK
jgi:hypothetical protein